MNTLVNNSEITKHVSAVIISAVVTFIAPALPSLALITAMIAADFVSARMLARRIRRRLRDVGKFAPSSEAAAERLKFSSMRLGHMLGRLGRCYAILLLSHGVDCIIVGSPEPFVMKFMAAMICFREFWSILENEASDNNSPWARVARRVLVDKTSRHLGIDLQSYLDEAGISKQEDEK